MFSKRYDIGTFGDIPFRISRLWIFVFILVTYSLSQPGSLDDYLSVISIFAPTTLESPVLTSQLGMFVFSAALVLTLYTCVILHELGHIYGARKHDVPVDGITLWVLGGAAHIEEPDNPRAEFELTIAGPLVSFALGIVAAIIAYAIAPLGITVLTAFFFMIALMNLGMLILNLVPAFPLDGGRLLRSALAAAYGQQRGTAYATRLGKGLALLLAIGSLASLYLFGLLLAGFVFLASRSENNRVQNDPSADLHRLAAESIDVTGNTFVFETSVPGMTLPSTAAFIERHGGTVGLHVTDDTDYLVVPADAPDMYSTIASHHDATLVPSPIIADVIEHTAQQQLDRVASEYNTHRVGPDAFGRDSSAKHGRGRTSDPDHDIGPVSDD